MEVAFDERLPLRACWCSGDAAVSRRSSALNSHSFLESACTRMARWNKGTMVWGLAGRLVLLASVVLLASAALSCTASVSANGNTVEILRTVEGSYEVVVGVLPERPTVGVVHFSIAPLGRRARLPVTDAQVLIVANDEQGVPTYQAPALNTPSAPQYYDANITFESRAPGTWSSMFGVQSWARPGLSYPSTWNPRRCHQDSRGRLCGWCCWLCCSRELRTCGAQPGAAIAEAKSDASPSPRTTQPQRIPASRGTLSLRRVRRQVALVG